MYKVFVFFIISVHLNCFGQRIPDSWLGHYKGMMELFSVKETPVAMVPVEFKLSKLTQDSSWQYQMIYGEKGKPGFVEKNYTIELKLDTLVMNEGDGIKIRMRRMGECLFDFYTITGESETFMSSIMCHQNNGDIEFNLFGGSLNQTEVTSITVAEDNGAFGLSTYPVSFNQHVIFKKINQ